MDITLKLTCTLFLSFLFVNAENTIWLTGTETKTPPTLACGGVDLVFLVDTSRSIWGLDFKRQIDFVDKVVSKFDIGPAKHQTRVGVILYAQTFWVRFYLRSHLDLPSLRVAIQRIPHKHGSKTRTEKALKFLKTHMFKKWYGGRKNATHVAILISDGRSQDRKATRKEARKAKEAGIKIFTIGVGKRADLEELKEIASDPDDYFVFHVGDFKALDSLNYKLPTSTCVAGDITTKTTTIHTTSTTAVETTTTRPIELSEPLTFLELEGSGVVPSSVDIDQGVGDKSNNVLHDIITPATKTQGLPTEKLYHPEHGLIGLTKEAIEIIQDNLKGSLATDRTLDISGNSQQIVGENTTQNEFITTSYQTTTPVTIIDNNIKQDSHESDRTIVLLNKNSHHVLATPPSLQSKRIYTTRSKGTISRIMPPATAISSTRSNRIPEGFTMATPVGQGRTTTISNEILQGLAAYSLRPITEDQAQIMSNYILRDVPAQTYCDGKDADIYFVLDASNSIWPEDFKQQLSFVNNVIDILDVTHGNTRVGVVVYSTQIHPIVMIDSGLSKRQIKRQVNAIKYVSGRTNTSDALRFIRNYGFAPALQRKGAVKLGIILTDGISRNPIATKAESNRCREANINLFAVGIGKHVDQTELKRIANDPDQRFMFHVDSYAALNSIKDFLAITACSVVPDQPSNLPICSGLGPMDVLFTYDSFALGSRKSQMINFFIHDVLNSLDFSNGNLQVGRLTDNCPEVTNIPISAGKNLSAFATTTYPGISSLLQKMNSSFSNRQDAKKLGVLFLDDSTEGVERAIQVIKMGLDFKLMVIGIGDHKTTDSAGDLCSYPKHDYFLQVPKYSSLLRIRSKLLDKLCTSMIAAG